MNLLPELPVAGITFERGGGFLIEPFASGGVDVQTPHAPDEPDSALGARAFTGYALSP